MHSFIDQKFVIANYYKRLDCTNVYQGKIKGKKQNVLVFDFVPPTISSLQKAINEFINRFLLSSSGQLSVSDCHIDIVNGHIIFAMNPDLLNIAAEFIESITTQDVDLPTRLSLSMRNSSTKLRAISGDDEEDPESVNVFQRAVYSTSAKSTMLLNGQEEDDEVFFEFDDPLNDQFKKNYPKTEGHIESESSSPKTNPSKPLHIDPTNAPTQALTRVDSQFSPDIEKVKELMQADYSSWKLDQNEKDKKVYVKFKEGDSRINVRSEATLYDFNIDILAQMNIDLAKRKDWDGSFTNMQLSKKLSENEDVIYHEMKMPFPLSNRDFVQYRYYVNNFLHPEEVEQRGLWKTPNKYWVIVLQSVIMDEHPEKKGAVRGENTTTMIFEEDKDDPKKVHYKMVSATDLKGNIPLWVLQSAVGKQAAKVMDQTFDSYRKFASRWSSAAH